MCQRGSLLRLIAMTAVKGIEDVIEMRMFVGSIRMMKRLSRLPVQGDVPAKHEESAKKDELVMVRIARTCPDLIVMATELRSRVM